MPGKKTPATTPLDQLADLIDDRPGPPGPPRGPRRIRQQLIAQRRRWSRLECERLERLERLTYKELLERLKTLVRPRLGSERHALIEMARDFLPRARYARAFFLLTLRYQWGDPGTALEDRDAGRDEWPTDPAEQKLGKAGRAVLGRLLEEWSFRGRHRGLPLQSTIVAAIVRDHARIHADVVRIFANNRGIESQKERKDALRLLVQCEIPDSPEIFRLVKGKESRFDRLLKRTSLRPVTASVQVVAWKYDTDPRTVTRALSQHRSHD